MKKTIIYFCFILISAPAFAQKTNNTDTLIQFYKKKIQKYICKNDSLKDQYSIDKKGISLYASADKKKKDSAEFILQWKEVGWFRSVLLHQSESSQMKF